MLETETSYWKRCEQWTHFKRSLFYNHDNPIQTIQFYLQKGIVTHHVGPNVLTVHVLYDLLKTWWVEQWSHVKDIWVCIGCIIVALLCVKCFCAWRGPWAERQSQPLLPLIPHIPLSPWLGLQCFCVAMTGLHLPGGPPPQPVPPCSGTRQHFLLSFGAFPHRFEHPSLISGISLVSLWTMRTLSLARSPFLSVSCPLLLSCGFLFIQIFFPLFSSLSLSCSFLVFSFSPFSPSSPVGPLFSLSKMPFSSPLPLYPCSWEELETICFIY